MSRERGNERMRRAFAMCGHNSRILMDSASVSWLRDVITPGPVHIDRATYYYLMFNLSTLIYNYKRCVTFNCDTFVFYSFIIFL